MAQNRESDGYIRIMKFIIASVFGDGVGIGWQLLNKGHDVKICFLDTFYHNQYQGILPTIKLDEIKDETIIWDMTGKTVLAEKLKANGKKIVGAGMGINKNGESIIDVLEDDRLSAFQLIAPCGINTSEWRYFKDAKQAIPFVRSSDKRWVVKVLGKTTIDMTFVSKDNEELAQKLQKFSQETQLKDGLILQEFIEGTEVSCEVFISNGKYVKGSVNYTLETKKFMNGDEGEQTGCQSSVVWFGEGRAFEESLKKLEPFINRTQYNGFLDCNGIIDEKGKYYWLEFTPRIGYSSFYAMANCLDMPLGELLSGMADGSLAEVKTKVGFGVSVRVSIPPYPYETKQNPPKTLTKECLKSLEKTGEYFGSYEAMVHRLLYRSSMDELVEFPIDDPAYIPIDVYFRDGKFYTAGNSAIICEVQGFGKTIAEASNRALEARKELRVANGRCRTDFALNSEKRHSELKAKNYL